MDTKRNKLIYRIVTGLFSLMLFGGAMMYFAQYEMVSEKFVALGFPTFIIYPLAVAKLLGLVAIWTRKSLLLKDLAYAGFFYDLILASAAHIAIGDGEQWAAIGALVLVIVSYTFERRVYGSRA